ncbi:hypothetical protein D3C72_2403090 [compost metagenome]
MIEAEYGALVHVQLVVAKTEEILRKMVVANSADQVCHFIHAGDHAGFSSCRTVVVLSGCGRVVIADASVQTQYTHS